MGLMDRFQRWRERNLTEAERTERQQRRVERAVLRNKARDDRWSGTEHGGDGYPRGGTGGAGGGM